MSKLGKGIGLYFSNNEICLNLGTTIGGGGKRGKIKGMTRKSRSAMMHLLNSLVYETVSFITLTYHYNQRDDTRAYRDLRLLHKALVRKHGGFGAVWKKEYQKRGAVHYHLFMYDLPSGAGESEIVDEWMRVTEQEGDKAARLYGVHNKTFDVLHHKDAGVMLAYMAKYSTKETSTGHGRQWGVLGRKYLTETGGSRDVSPEDAVILAEKLIRAGAQKFEITPTGIQYRLYLGHVGCWQNADGGGSALDFIAEISEAVVR